MIGMDAPGAADKQSETETQPGSEQARRHLIHFSRTRV